MIYSKSKLLFIFFILILISSNIYAYDDTPKRLAIFTVRILELLFIFGFVQFFMRHKNKNKVAKKHYI